MGQSPYMAPILMLNEAEDDETTSKEIGCRHLSQLKGNFNWGTGASDGVVVAEIASHVGYVGTWQEIARSDLGDLIAGDSIAAPRTEDYVYPGPVGAVRHRVIEAVVGGSLTSYHDGYSN